MTQLTINAKEQKKNLAPLFKVINNSSVLPILENILVQQKEDKVSFTATDLENIVECWFDAGKLDTPFCMPARMLKNVLQNAIQDVVEIKVSDKDLSISNDEFILHSIIEDYGDFPKPVKMLPALKITIDAELLNTHLANAKLFLSKDYLRPALTGVSIRKVGSKIEIAATDAHKLYWNELMDAPDKLEEMNIILPQKCVTIAIEMFKKGLVTIEIYDLHIRLSQEGKTLTSRLVDAKFPDYHAVIPRLDFSCNLKRKDFKAFLNMAYPFANTDSHKLSFEIKPDFIEFEARNLNYNDIVHFKLPIYNVQKEMALTKIAFNIRFLMDILKVKAKDEYVKFEMRQSNKAAIIDGCCMLMPLMINE